MLSQGNWILVEQNDPNCVIKKLRLEDGWLYKVLHVRQWDCYNKPLDYDAHHFHVKERE